MIPKTKNSHHPEMWLLSSIWEYAANSIFCGGKTFSCKKNECKET